MYKVLLLLILFQLFPKDPLLAHVNNEPTELILADENKITSPVLSVLNIFHLALDGDSIHIHSLKDLSKVYRNPMHWKKLIENFNFVEVTTRAVRAYNLGSANKEFVDHAKNLVMIFPLSHGLEVLAAPAFVAVTSFLDWPGYLIAGGGTALSIIALPGLDPLCLLILATYPLKPVYKTINSIRKTIERSFDLGLGITGIRRYLKKSLQNKDSFIYLQNAIESNFNTSRIKTGFNIQIESSDEKIIFKVVNMDNGIDELTLEFHIQDSSNSKSSSHIYLHELRLLNPSGKMNGEKSLLNIVKPLFSWNVRRAIKEIQYGLNTDNLHNLEDKFYVSHIEKDEVLKIEFIDRAIHWGSQRYWFSDKKVKSHFLTKLQNCELALNQF